MARANFRRVKGDGPMIRRKPKAEQHDPLNPSLHGNASGNVPLPDPFSEALRRSPALEVAYRMGAFGRDEPKEEASLADIFLAETYTMGKRLGLNAHQAKNVEPILQSYRRDLRKAHKFVLDDDFVRYITEISSTTSPEKLLARLQYANLPYDTVWIEFNLKEKVRVMRAVHNMDNSKFDWNDVADRLGLILRRIDDTTSVVEIICETYGSYGFIGTTICYFFSVDGHEFTYEDRIYGCKPLLFAASVREAIMQGKVDEEVQRLVSDDRLTSMGAGSLWGYGTFGQSMVIEKLTQMRQLTLPVYLMRHGTLGTGRMKEIIGTFIRGTKNDREVLDTLSSLMLQETTEFTGMMRWIVCVLAALNEVPIATRLVEPKGFIRTGLTERRPMMQHHVVTLRVPKKNPIKYIERQFRVASRRRAHEVRGHWRTYVRDDSCKYDEHDWQYEHSEGWRVCNKCTAFGRFVKEHIRGDASLGWVTHSYVVKPARQT